MVKINKKELLILIKNWKLNQKIIDLTDKGLINLAEKIIDYETKKKKK